MPENMTHSLSEAYGALLAPSHVFNPAELAGNGAMVPAERGIYGWWFDAALPGAPRDGAVERDEWHLLYVGIAPNGTSETSVRNLRSRLRDHCAGQLARSTLRRTIASLLHKPLGLTISRSLRDKPVMSANDERRLNDWMALHMRVAWLVHPTPWQVETELVGQGLFPLNVAGSTHPFAPVLKRLRAELGRTAERAEFPVSPT